MSSVGQIIKEARIRQNIKQVSLAKGICSPSYLSKIENNILPPKEDILRLLLKKLNLELNDISNDEEIHFMTTLLELYREAILHRDKNQITDFLQKFSKPNMNFFQSDNYFTYHLYMFRLLLIERKNLEELSNYINILSQLQKDFNLKQRFLYNLNLGLFNYFINNNHKALSQLERSLPLLNEISLNEWELADFYNAISICYSKNSDYINAIKYSSKALSYFKENYVFERTIDSYIVIGNAQQNLLDYKSAEESFTLAQSLVKKLNITHYDGMIYHNLGSLYAIQGEHTKSIENYELSLYSKQQNKQFHKSLSTVLSIIQEYAKYRNSIQVIHWCEKGLNILLKNSNLSNEQIFKSYNFHFEIYRTLYQLSDDLEYILKDGIKYYEIIQDYRYVQKYSIILGDYYYKKHKYKNASRYYKKSNEFLLKQKAIQLEEM